MGNPAQEKIFLSAYDTYADAIFRFCHYKTSDREQAQDITQATFLKLWTYMEGGQEVENVRPLLYQIAGNLVIDWYRKKKSGSLDSLMEGGFDPAAPKAEGETSAEYQWALHELKKLEPDDQQLIIWRYVEDMNPKQIGELIGQSENTASMRVYRALKKLKKVLRVQTEQE